MSVGTVNSDDDDVGQVAAALADAAHHGGLSSGRYRRADGALGRIEARLSSLAARLKTAEELGGEARANAFAELVDALRAATDAQLPEPVTYEDAAVFVEKYAALDFGDSGEGGAS